MVEGAGWPRRRKLTNCGGGLMVRLDEGEDGLGLMGLRID